MVDIIEGDLAVRVDGLKGIKTTGDESVDGLRVARARTMVLGA